MDDKVKVVVSDTGQIDSWIIKLLLQKRGCEMVEVYRLSRRSWCTR